MVEEEAEFLSRELFAKACETPLYHLWLRKYPDHKQMRRAFLGGEG